MKKVALGIDIGGTGTKYGFVDKEGKIYCESSIPTPKQSKKKVKTSKYFLTNSTTR